MATAKNQTNGRLEEATTAMIQNQATLLQTQAAFVQSQFAYAARMAEADQRMAEADRRFEQLRQEAAEWFARIEAILLDHSRILTEHNQLLQALTDAIREKIGFKIPEKPTAT